MSSTTTLPWPRPMFAGRVETPSMYPTRSGAPSSHRVRSMTAPCAISSPSTRRRTCRPPNVRSQSSCENRPAQAAANNARICARSSSVSPSLWTTRCWITEWLQLQDRTGQRSRDAIELLHRHHGPLRQQVQVLRLGARDDVVRTRDGIDGDDAFDPSNHLGHVPGLAHFRLDQDVGANHRFPFSPDGLPIVGGAMGLPQIGRSEPLQCPTSGALRAGVPSAKLATNAAPSASTQALR